jgi:hypothetical protein
LRAEVRPVRASERRAPPDRLRDFRNGVTIGGISTLGFACPKALNWVGFKNITEHWLQAKKAVS